MNFNDFKAKFGKYANNTQFLVILLVVILFIIAALVVYRRYIAAGISREYVANNEFTNDGGSIQSADIYFFYTTWCPHCKTAKPIWEEFREEMKDKKVNGIKLNFFEVDCDKDTATSDKFKVKGFPTIKLVKGKQIIEYDAKPNKVTLIEFVNTSLNA